MNIENIPIIRLERNKGQLEGLPKNPRLIRDERFESLKKSITDAPDMLQLRELLVYPLKNGNYVVIGGNMRLAACIDLGFTELPCKIIDKSVSIDKLREYTIKDNEGFGQPDWELLEEDWDIHELESWGMDVSTLKQDEWENLPLIEEEQEAPSLEKPTQIIVTIPFEEKDIEVEVRKKVREAVEEYPNIKVV